MPSIEIFRAGPHRTAQGKPVTVTAADLAAVAASYDPAAHEAPAVIGHPKDTDPAYGWVKGLRVDGDRLVADLDQVNDDFAELVRQGAFKKVSASFYPAGSSANPKPQGMYLRHVGFLGAQPPAIKGLAPINFADDGADVLDFGEVRAGDVSWLARTVGELMRGFREYVIERDGAEKADQVIPSWRIDDMAATAGRIEAQAADAVPANFSEPDPATTKEAPVADPNAPSAAELKAREAKLDADRLEFSEQQRTFRRQTHGAFLDGLVAAGKPLPAPKDQLLDFMEALAGGETLDFGEVGGKVAPLDFFKDQVLAKLPAQVDFRERAPGDNGTLDFAEDGAAIGAAAAAYAAEMAAKGVTVTATQAVAHVKKGASA